MNAYKIIDQNNGKVLDTVLAASEYKALQVYRDNNGYRVNLKAVAS